MSGPSGGAGAAARRPPPRAWAGRSVVPACPPRSPRTSRARSCAWPGRCARRRRGSLLVIALAILSVTCAVVGPKILGNATDIIFDGVVSQQIPDGLTQQQAVDALRASGQTQQADLLASLTLTPGQDGVDFTALRNTLLFVAAIYLLSSLFAWGQSYIMAGVTQRTVYRMRRDVDAKLSRLPLQLLRQPPARRHAEPRHQRHRQHRELAPADAHPAHHRAVHDHRRHRDHVLDQPAAGGHLAADRAPVDRGHGVRRQALVAAVRGPVDADRQAQRARRGDAHRAQHRQGVRPPAGGDRDLRRRRTSSSSRRASRRSSCRARSSRSWPSSPTSTTSRSASSAASRSPTGR